MNVPNLPAKPEKVAKDATASGEWDRVAKMLSARGVLASADLNERLAYLCLAYSAVKSLLDCVERYGRNAETQPTCEDLVELIELYRRRCAELGIEPGPLVRLRPMSET